MSHLIEEYAKSLGVKIGKPIINDHYYPIVDNKYITIHSDNKIASKYYEYFPQVINLIKPILNKYGYKIYQIGGPNDPPLAEVDAHFFNLTYRQSANVIKNSKLHLGIDSLPVHIASMYDVPIVALYSHIMAANASPFWSSKEKVILLESDKGDNRASYAYEENPKTIRTIKPETIAQSVFKLLDIEEKINFKTIKVGNVFHHSITEVIPNFLANLENQKDVVYLRADLNFDLEKMAFWCQKYKCVIITNNEIPIDFARHFSNNIQNIFFKISDKNISLEYLENLKTTKIKFAICCQDEEKLSDFKNYYFDFNVEFDNVKERVKNVEKINAKFFTNKILLSKAMLYPSEAHLKNEKTLDINNEVIYDDDSFWKDIEHYYFYE